MLLLYKMCDCNQNKNLEKKNIIKINISKLDYFLKNSKFYLTIYKNNKIKKVFYKIPPKIKTTKKLLKYISDKKMAIIKKINIPKKIIFTIRNIKYCQKIPCYIKTLEQLTLFLNNVSTQLKINFKQNYVLVNGKFMTRADLFYLKQNDFTNYLNKHSLEGVCYDSNIVH